MRRSLSAALLLLAAPAFAQADESTPPLLPPPPIVEAPAAPVDPAVVGSWALVEVEDAGIMGDLGAEIDDLRLQIEADGDTFVEMEITQDRETTEREDAFTCTARDGQIVADDRPVVEYELLGQNQIRLIDDKGIVLRMKRVQSDVARR